jgi:hypothetical protein
MRLKVPPLWPRIASVTVTFIPIFCNPLAHPSQIMNAPRRVRPHRGSYRTFLPKREKTVRHARKLTTVVAPFFPRYMFIILDPEHDQFMNAPRRVRPHRGVETDRECRRSHRSGPVRARK